jgi:hypothetical protein
VQSNLANTPGAKTLIDQGYAAQVLGLGAMPSSTISFIWKSQAIRR